MSASITRLFSGLRRRTLEPVPSPDEARDARLRAVRDSIHSEMLSSARVPEPVPQAESTQSTDEEREVQGNPEVAAHEDYLWDSAYRAALEAAVRAVEDAWSRQANPAADIVALEVPPVPRSVAVGMNMIAERTASPNTQMPEYAHPAHWGKTVPFEWMEGYMARKAEDDEDTCPYGRSEPEKALDWRIGWIFRFETEDD